MKPMVILTGPTAVGKTELSIGLAKKINGEIISADSMQVYKKMNIGTAKIKREEMDGVKHYLVDELDPSEEFNVVKFQAMAHKAMEEIYTKGKIPILVGGTGFYIQALVYEVDFQKEDGDKKYRTFLEDLEKEKGKEYLHEMLLKVDPVSAEKIHPNNVKKVIRAIEFYHVNQKPISQHNEEEKKKESPYNFAYFVLNHKREVLYHRINERVDIMMKEGLLEEVEHLVKEGYTKDLVSMQGIGYKEVFNYFEKKCSYDEMVEKIKQDTRNFAKRQLTWFRREKEVFMLEKQNYKTEDEILNIILEELQKRGIYEG